MYLRRANESAEAAWGPPYRLPSFGGLGTPDPPPRGLQLLPHYHCLAQPGPIVIQTLNQDSLDPGYQSDQKLQESLRVVLQQAPFRDFLVDKTAQSATAKDRIRVALVDLSGPKLLKPWFAGYGSTVAMKAGSLAKLLALYAVYQLKMDLTCLASSRVPAIEKKAELIRAAIAAGYPGRNGELTELFDFTERPKTWPLIGLTAATTDHLLRIVGTAGSCASNGSATWLIHQLGYPYLASLAWQSGLRRAATKGLWLHGDYATLDECMSRKKGRKTPMPNGQPRPEARWEPVWRSTPLKDAHWHECNAASVAKYFTLIAQGRLAGGSSSAQLRKLLTQGFATASTFAQAFAGQHIGLNEFSSKGGFLNPDEGDVDHEGALIRRSRPGKTEIQYVAAVLTHGVKEADIQKMILKLDELVSSFN